METELNVSPGVLEELRYHGYRVVKLERKYAPLDPHIDIDLPMYVITDELTND